jgi:hypothetical protein
MDNRANTTREALRTGRLLMVLSGFSPVFVLWAIRGDSPLPDGIFVALCALMVIVPNAYVALRIAAARRAHEVRELVIGDAEDHRDHLLIYLFAMLLPFYAPDLSTWRNFAAVAVALAFVVFLFWSMNLHYQNVLLAIFGYRVFTVPPAKDDNPMSGTRTIVLITRRERLQPGEQLKALRLSDTVYLED